MVKTLGWTLVLAGMAAVGVDVSRAPEHQWSARAVVGTIHVYQATASRLFAASGVTCRFDPSCSHYGEAVIRRFGVLRGGSLAAARVLRCGPWTALGTPDPPPGG